MVRNKETQYFQLDRFSLMINPACYLVMVSRSGPLESATTDASFPEWIFDSRHAIWLTEEEKPIAERARRGDEIKKFLKALLFGKASSR